jgi:hypothetical protein
MVLKTIGYFVMPRSLTVVDVDWNMAPYIVDRERKPEPTHM